MYKYEIILLFENVENRQEEVKKCIEELHPCQTQNVEFEGMFNDRRGINIRKKYSSKEEYENIMNIKDKYDLIYLHRHPPYFFFVPLYNPEGGLCDKHYD